MLKYIAGLTQGVSAKKNEDCYYVPRKRPSIRRC